MQFLQGIDRWMIGIDLQDALRGRHFATLAHALHDAFHVRAHRPIVANQADRAFLEPVRKPGFLDVGEFLLQESKKRGKPLLLGWIDLGRGQLALIDRLEPFAFELAERGDQELIDRFGKQEHLLTANLELSRKGEFSSSSRFSPVR